MPSSPVFDIAVIGAGIAGASVAYRLSSARSVILLEREAQPGYHSTGRSAAMFIESYGPPAVRALTRASRAFYLAPPGGFAEHPLLSPRGALYLARHDQFALLAQEFAQLSTTCPGLTRLDHDETMALVACLRPEVVGASMLDNDSMDIDVNSLHQGFLRGFKRAGGVLRNNAEVVGARRDGASWDLALTDGTRLRAGSVVNAAGAWADQVGTLFGACSIGLVPHRRTAFTFAAPAGVDTARWPVVSGIDESYYFKPESGVMLGSPANADAMHAHDVVPEELDVATGIHHIEANTTMTIRRPIRTWAGLRSFVPDGEMVIGWDGRAEGFFWLAGQGGYGIQSAPGASELAASLILAQELPEGISRQGVALAALLPTRFG
ncbi:MAG: FAD-dependent oxidoreductase [Burkholderiaceae bacterium]